MTEESFLMVSLDEEKSKKLAQVLSNDTARKILDILSKQDMMTETQVAKELTIPLSTAHYNLSLLIKSDLINDNHFTYSEKGKKIIHYQLSNKYVIIRISVKPTLNIRITRSLILIQKNMAKKQFIPPKLPAKINYDNLIEDITKAHRSMASLNALLSHLPNPELLGRAMKTKEAVLSSKIEGTEATINEVFEFEAKAGGSKDPEKKEDIHEIINYREALDLGIKSLDKIPLSENLVKKLHATLLRSGRGYNKAPGEFRKIQVYIGRPGAGIEEASFVPPPANEIIPLFSNLEKYLNSNEERDKLVQIAVVHYQFEAIHPFLDGNGRVGRLLISLFLYERGLLSHPFLYLSEFFEEHRKDYYELLRGVSEKQDWQAWIKFFLYALATQTQKAEKTGKDILSLYKKYKEEITELNSAYAINLLDAIFVHPVFSTASIRKKAKIKNTQTFFNLVGKFVEAKIIEDSTPEKQRNKIYKFTELLKILK